MNLTYTVPKPIRRPFETGEIVEFCDRDLKVLSELKIVRAGKRIVRVEDGRTFRATDGWYVGEQAWPFPSIRHKKARKVKAK